MKNTLEKIYNASLKFLVPLTVEETCHIIVQEAIWFVNGDYGSILLEEKGELKRVYASNPILYQIKPRKGGFMYNVFRNRQPIILTSKEIERIHPEIKQTQICLDILVPISYKDKSIGVLTVMSEKVKQFTKKDMNTLNFFSPMASLAIKKAQLYNETKALLESRELFLSLASHELRTPLTSINGYVQLLKNKLGDSDSTESRWLEELSWETQRLTGMVHELLQVNRIKSGQLHYIFKICSLREVIKRAITNFHFNHSDYTLSINDQLDGGDLIVGDFDKLVQVCTNLLDNAAKFSPEDQKIIISLRKRGLYLLLSVKDLGIGIAKKDLHRIFEGFYKSSSSTKQGIGLGLFLVKSIIEKHHGFINVRSKENKGTTLEVKLPQAK